MLSRVHKRVLLISTPTLLLSAGLVWIAVNGLLEYPWHQSNIPFYVIAIVGVLAGFMWTIFSLRRLGIRSAILMGFLMGVASTGFAGILFLYIQFANSALDFRAPRTVEALVTHKWTETRLGKRSTRLAYLISIETPLEEPSNRTITVKHSMWGAVNKGGRAKLIIGQGLFWPYVSGIEKIPLENSLPTSFDLKGKNYLFPFSISDEK
jgi:hypothetical protein